MRMLLLLGVVTWHVTSSSAMSVPTSNYEATAAVTNSINTFSTNFFKTVAEEQPGKNVICSPLSASMVLTMAAYGAAGNTETQLRTALAMNKDDGLTKAGLRSLIDSFKNFKQVDLRLANKIFLAQGFTPKSEFMGITVTAFDSQAQSVDFSKSAEASKTINDWAEAQTNNRIKDLVQADDLDASTALVLVNAVYFKGNWASKFDAGLTMPRPFHVDATTVKDVPTMYRSGSYRYGELPEVKAKFVELPYKSKDESDAVSMFIILPDEIDGLANLEKNLDKVTVDVLRGGSQRDVNIYLPKFKIETTLNLQGTLGKMGLSDMFTPAANFTGIVDAPPLYVSKVVQKAFIEVNEEGSEAAAATALIVAVPASSAPIYREPPVELRVDHPFLYLIVMRSANTIIFQGHYKNIE